MAFGPPHGELLQVIVRDVLERGERVPAVLVAAVYEDSSCLARKMVVVSDICVGGRKARNRPTGKLAV